MNKFLKPVHLFGSKTLQCTWWTIHLHTRSGKTGDTFYKYDCIHKLHNWSPMCNTTSTTAKNYFDLPWSLRSPYCAFSIIHPCAFSIIWTIILHFAQPIELQYPHKTYKNNLYDFCLPTWPPHFDVSDSDEDGNENTRLLEIGKFKLLHVHPYNFTYLYN